MSKLEQDFQKASKEFQRLQADLTNTVEARQKLDYQQSESDLVLKELKKLTPENTVYKLIGPGLMPQDSGEAQQTVEKRLDFIKKEIDRIESQLKTIGEKAEKKKMEVIKLQTENAGAAAAGAKGIESIVAMAAKSHRTVASGNGQPGI